jgi:hypothetical protein
MAKIYDAIDGRLREFILAQPMFFVASAPSGSGGHVNLSPKGMLGTFVVVDSHRVAYADFTGSGAETAAHLRDNGRITIMFCAFTGPPKIVRLYGQGTYVRPEDAGFAALKARFALATGPGVAAPADLSGDGPSPGDTAASDHPLPASDHGLRGIVDVVVSRIADSCGYAVPLLEYSGERGLLVEWAGHRTADDLDAYRVQKNATSIDGLPALA